jgi:dTMP kinase
VRPTGAKGYQAGHPVLAQLDRRGEGSMLIAIEGIDGAGKATQAGLLRERLAAQGYRVAVLSFPRYGQTYFARSISDYLAGRFGALDAVDPHFAALLYAGDRLESKVVIAETVAAHDVVVFDRYVASNLAHQAARVPPERREEFLTWLGTVEHEVYELPRADLTVYLDVSTQAAAGMRERRGERATAPAADIHEASASYLERCAEVYRALLATSFLSQWVAAPCCDAAGQVLPLATIADAVWQAVQPSLAQRRPSSQAR